MIQGRRSWNVVQSPDGDWVLKGVFMPWESTELTAECIEQGPNTLDHNFGWGRAPHEDRREVFRTHICSTTRITHPRGGECGIYILFDDAPLYSGLEGYIEGIVTGWGMAAEYEKGWRVEYARIEMLKLLPAIRWHDDVRAIARDLKRRYNVPLLQTWDDKDGATPPVHPYVDYGWAGGWMG